MQTMQTMQARPDPAGPLSAGAATAVLGWLEWRSLVHAVSALRRNRTRAALWGAFLLIAVIAVVSRSLAGPSRPSAIGPAVNSVVAIAASGGFWLLAGLLGWAAVDRAPVSFPRRADAWLLPSSQLPIRVVVVWLGLRKQLFALAKVTPGLVWLMLDSARDTSAAGTGFAVLGLGALTVIVYPARLLAWRVGHRHRPLVKVSCAAVALGGLGLLLANAAPAVGAAHPLTVLAAHPIAAPPGSWWAGALMGNGLDLAALGALALAAVLATVALSGGELYPQLWAASQLGFRLRDLRGQGRGTITEFRSAAKQARADQRRLRQADRPAVLESPDRPSRARAHPVGSASRVPSGALAVAWREWLETIRRIGPIRAALAVMTAAAVGGVIGAVARSFSHPGPVLGGVVGAVFYSMALGNVVAAQRIGADLGRSLWWLSAAPVVQRLAVSTAAAAARQAALLVPAVIAALSVAGLGPDAIGLVPLVVALGWVFRAISVAVMSVMPGRADLRGPAMVIRVLAIFAVGMTLIAAAGAVYAFSHNVILAATAAALLAVGEGTVAVSFAARRFTGNGFAVAAASATS